MWTAAGGTSFRVLEKNSTPLGIGATYTTADFIISESTHVVGSVIADTTGVLHADFSADGISWNSTGNTEYIANVQLGFKIPVLGEYFRMRFVNDSGVGQTSFSFEMSAISLRT